jgi:hypothetical protein
MIDSKKNICEEVFPLPMDMLYTPQYIVVSKNLPSSLPPPMELYNDGPS